MKIRKASIADLPQLTELFNSYRIFYEMQTNREGAAEFLRARITNNESEIYVTVVDTTLTGFIQLYPLFSSVRMKKVWLLNDLFVKEEYRGQGFSIALIEQAKVLCKASGACGFMLSTSKQNTIGNALYQRMGLELETLYNTYSWDI